MRQNLPIITGLRFLAAFYVFLFHVNIRHTLDFFDSLTLSIISQGAVGVNSFFILSGFILYYTYSSRSKFFFIEFILKRLAKIYPVYLVGFITCFLLVILMNIRIDYFFEVLIMNLLLFQSYLPKFSQIWYGSGAWSISTEFFFYFSFPLILPYILKFSKNKAFLSLLLCYLFSIVSGILFNLKLIGFEFSYTFPLFRIPEFIIGMLTGLLVFKYKITINNILMFIIILFSSLYFVFIGRKLQGYVIHNIIVVPIMVSILIYVVTNSKNILRIFGTKFFEYLGKISYSFYIIQIPIMIFLDSYHFEYSNKLQLLAIIFFINLILSIFLYHIIEIPFHRLINKKINLIFNEKK